MNSNRTARLTGVGGGYILTTLSTKTVALKKYDLKCYKYIGKIDLKKIKKKTKSENNDLI